MRPLNFDCIKLPSHFFNSYATTTHVSLTQQRGGSGDLNKNCRTFLVDHHPIEIISSIKKNNNNNNKEFRLYQIEKS